MRPVKIKDLGEIVTGKTPSTKKPELFGNDYPFITPSDISSYDVYHIHNIERGLSQKGYLSQKSKLLPPKTVCYVCIGSTVGKICLTKESSFTNQQLNNIIVDRSRYVPEYIYYRLRYETPRIRSIAGGTGSGKAIYNKTAFEEHRLEIHDYPSQQKIASILSAYDDFIETNLRRIKILEEMVQFIYREWFVNFRFPGYETVRFVNSEFGRIPGDWKIKPLEIIANLYRGRSYRSDDLNGNDALPFFNLKNIQRNGGFRYEGTKLYSGKFKEDQKTRTGDILVAVTDMTQERNIVARATRIPKLKVEYGIFSMDLVRVGPRENISKYWLYGMLRYSQFSDQVKEYANGVNVLHLSPDRIKEYRAPIPPYDLQKQFDNIAENILFMMDRFHEKNENLRKTRDLLLPRLISGELDVSDLDIPMREQENDT